MMPRHVDGNALAGPLSDLFAFDVTCASGRCVGCGDVTVLARAMVYEDEMGFVARCHLCDSMLLTVVRTADGAWLDLQGISGLHVAL